jgi:hypothetical protein
MLTKLKSIGKKVISRSPLRNLISGMLLLVGCFVLLTFFHETLLIIIGILHGIAGVSLLIGSLVGHRKKSLVERKGPQATI